MWILFIWSQKGVFSFFFPHLWDVLSLHVVKTLSFLLMVLGLKSMVMLEE
jgi:hypothetical protein